MSRRRDHCNQKHCGPRVTPGGHRLAASAGLDPFQREHELADAIVTLIIAASRFATKNERAQDTADRFTFLQHVTVLVAHQIVERVRAVRGKESAAALRKALGRTGR